MARCTHGAGGSRGAHRWRRRPTPSARRLPAALAACLVLVLVAGGACVGTPRTATPGPEPAAPPAGGPQSLEVRYQDGTAAVGPFRQALGLRWVDEGRLLALVRHDGGESIVELARGEEGGAWRARTLLTLEEGSTPGAFYLWDYLQGGNSLLFTSLDGSLWRYDAGPPASGEPRLTRLQEGVFIFDVSPDHTRAVVYGREVELMDFRSGATVSLPRVPRYEFPFTGHGSSWSPDGTRYLYQRIEGQIKASFGILDARTGEEVRSVAPGDACAFDAVWSPDGRRVACLLLSGDPDQFLGEGELIPPVAQELGILDPATGTMERLSVPGRLVLGPLLWSPGGEKLAFAAGTPGRSGEGDPSGRTALYVASLSQEGWRVTGVTAEAAGVRYLPRCWAPGGAALAFTAWRDGPAPAYTLQVSTAAAAPDGTTGWTEPVPLEDLTDRVVWLDGRTLAGLQKGGTIGLISLDGCAPVTLEGPPVQGSELCPSPSGRYLAYTVETPAEGDTLTTLKVMAAPASGT